jgi:hypothetical protein
MLQITEVPIVRIYSDNCAAEVDAGLVEKVRDQFVIVFIRGCWDIRQRGRVGNAREGELVLSFSLLSVMG